MKVMIGGIESKKRIGLILTVFALLVSSLALFTVAHQKSKGADVGEGYLYQVYGETMGDTTQGSKGYSVLVLGKDYDSNRTDAIICATFREDGGISTLQIPRDTYVTDGDYKGRINGLFPMYRANAVAKGDADPTGSAAAELAHKIEKDFGISCNSYVFLDVGAVAAITDAIGGVMVDIPTDIDYTDEARGMDLHLKAGAQKLDGKTASQFVRYRQGYPQADIGRINAQKLYASAVLSKLQSLSSVTAAVKIIDTAAAYVKTDMDAQTIATLATKLCTAKPDRVLMYTTPGDGVKINGGSYYGVFSDVLCEVLANGFDVDCTASELTIQSFTTKSGGYRDTEGIKLSTVIEQGIAIPVYKNENN